MRFSLLSMFFAFAFFTSFSKISTQQQKKTSYWPFYESENRGFNPERVIFGGNLGIDFILSPNIDTTFTHKGFQAFVSPTFGYRFGSRLWVGINAGFGYLLDKIEYKNLINPYIYEKYTLKSSYYTVSLYTRFFASRNLFVHVEPELISTKDLKPITQSDGKINFQTTKVDTKAFLTGIGVVVPVGQRSAFVIQTLYDVLQEKNSPYSNLPVIRGGFNIGLF